LATETKSSEPEGAEYVKGVYPASRVLPVVEAMVVCRPTIGVPAESTDNTFRVEVIWGFPRPATRDTSFEKSPVTAP
jgi:hypothetical protein